MKISKTLKPLRRRIFRGFTLAEVLVTLMIIGVIASITIPSLKKSTDEKSSIANLKKAYSVLSNATGMLEVEYGSIKRWSWNDWAVIMDEMYIPLFNVTKNCKLAGGCWDYDLSGNAYKSGGGMYTFITADGMTWAIGGRDKTCSSVEDTYIKNGCGWFEVDVNGPKKPNQKGVDVLGFTITPEGVFPFGGCPGCNYGSCAGGTATAGWGCTARLLNEGKYSW
jgi:prepilin-type N-terminal cleavage/methylation domain-containing protein